MKKLMVTLTPLISGLLFGMGMSLSGMIDPQKVIGFLDVTGSWDPSLAFVMGGALAVFMPAYFLVIKPRTVSVSQDQISTPSSSQVDTRLIVGSALFGIGWGTAGICPGPAVSSVWFGGYPVVLFLSTMILGSLLAKQFLNRRDSVKIAKAT
ncbi:transporter component [Vibrio orientalis CIP 102891 = ATCC 33934]|uniref:Transporter component n=2 Tax=Vibrio orientalis CIP 102891 = ATCC 33934 TaxID=675816 RepID=F9SWL8_VIBOR|nr:YeeE/YedE family protein [Vibrio orientalis]EGU47508.1 transporter component [Vibrio orientalis CIP 102891 = ATCC 33934]